MSRFERCLLYGMSVLVVAGVLASGLWGREAVRPVVHAADVHDNAPLDVLRRGIAFAQHTCIAERDRAESLERVSVLFESLSLGQLQNAVSYALSTFLKERDRGEKLDTSSAPGKRTLAKDAFLRGQDWFKVEQTLRKLYLDEVRRMTKEVATNKLRAKEARQRSQDWLRTEQVLKGIFTAEVQRMKGAAGVKLPSSLTTGR